MFFGRNLDSGLGLVRLLDLHLRFKFADDFLERNKWLAQVVDVRLVDFIRNDEQVLFFGELDDAFDVISQKRLARRISRVHDHDSIHLDIFLAGVRLQFRNPVPSVLLLVQLVLEQVKV